MLQLLIRVDASENIGVGHVMRCLTLALEMNARGCRVDFICRSLQGDQINYIERQGFTVHRLPELNSRNIQNPKNAAVGSDSETMQQNFDALETKAVIDAMEMPVDILVVDHYDLDHVWEHQIIEHTDAKLFVIDDMANRKHRCHYLLDQNYYPNMSSRYDGLLSGQCVKLLGPEYAMVRREFLAARSVQTNRNGKIKNILVMFGGTDPSCQTEKTLSALAANDSLKLDVIVGCSNPRRKSIERYCSNIKSVAFHCQPDNVAQIMTKTDLAVGAGGSSSWERCCLGIPSLVIATAENQEPIASGCEAAGVAVYLGKSDDVTQNDIIAAVDRLRKDSPAMVRMCRSAMKLVTGDGVLRIADILQTQEKNRI